MAFRPVSMKDAILVLGDEATATDFAIQLTSVTLTPDVSVERIKTLKPAGRYAAVDDPEWSLDTGYVYGYDDAATAEAAYSEYLRAHSGELVSFAFEPINGKGDRYEGEVWILAGAIGGDQGSFSTQSVSLPVEGQPERGVATGAAVIAAPPAG